MKNIYIYILTFIILTPLLIQGINMEPSMIIPTKYFPGTILSPPHGVYSFTPSNYTPVYITGYSHYIIMLGKTRGTPNLFLEVIDTYNGITVKKTDLGLPTNSVGGYHIWSPLRSSFMLLTINTPMGVRGFIFRFNKPNIPVDQFNYNIKRVLTSDNYILVDTGGQGFYIIDKNQTYRISGLGLANILTIYEYNNTLLLIGVSMNGSIGIEGLKQGGAGGFSRLDGVTTNIPYEEGLFIDAYAGNILVVHPSSEVYLVSIGIGQRRISLKVIIHRSIQDAFNHPPLIIDKYIVHPTTSNSTFAINVYDRYLHLVAQRPVSTGNPTYWYWPGLGHKYLILKVRTKSKTLKLYTYTPGGELVLINQLSEAYVYRMDPVFNGMLWLYVNRTRVKGETTYYLHLSTIDTKYTILLGRLADPKTVTATTSGGGITVTAYNVKTTTLQSGRKVKVYNVLFRYVKDLAVLIPEGMPVDVHVIDNHNREYIYSSIVPGQPVVVSSGNLYLRLIPSKGYTGAPDNYKPIPINVKPLSLITINALQYSSPLVVSGPPAELSFKPEGSGSPFVLVHPGGTITYYLPPGRYTVTIRFENGGVSSAILDLTPGVEAKLDLSQHKPAPSIIDIIIDNIVPITIIIITIAAVMIIIFAILTARISPPE